MLLAAITSEDYYNILNDPTFGYTSVTPLDILTHLNSTYGTITAKDLEKNRKALKAAWNPDDDDIATLWTRVRENQNFARGTPEPITDSTAMLLIPKALTAPGVMSQYINEWKRRNTAAQTYADFKAHFDRANKVRVEELTAAQAGYRNSANAATTPQTATPTASPATQPTVRVDNLVNSFTAGPMDLEKIHAIPAKRA
jgi:hypothetical protein